MDGYKHLIKKIYFLGMASLFMAFSSACGGSFNGEVIDVPMTEDETPQNVDEPQNSKVQNQIIDILDDHLDQTGMDNSKFRSAIVGVVHGGEKYLLSFGKTSKGQAPTESTVYPLNSITKMITGVMLAKGEVEGDFLLSDQIGTLLRSDLRNNLNGVTLGMLVSHHAGFAFLPSNRNGTPESPFSFYDRTNLSSCLANPNCGYQFPIGESYHYSNLGLGLLGLGITDHYGYVDFEILFAQKMGIPLGLNNTHNNNDTYTVGIASKIVKGRTTSGELVDPAKMGVLASGGGLLTDGTDMLKLLNVLVEPEGHWKSILTKAQQKIRPINSSKFICYGFDSYQNGSNEVFAKSGGQAGYSSYIVWSPSLKSGVFILTDQSGLIPDLAEASDKIIDVFQLVDSSDSN